MKNKTLIRAASGVLACGMVFGLAACGSSGSDSAATAESAASSDSADSAAGSDAASSSASSDAETTDEYAYLADFLLSDGFDENGYLVGVTAQDYVTLPDLSTLTLSDEANTVTDDDISSYITENILSDYSTTNEVTDRAAQDGDTVNIDYAGSVDGVAFTGGTTTGYDLMLGSGSFIDGFEEQIVGHTPGETFDITVTFPDGYNDSTDEDGNTVVLSGKEAVFSITLNYISEDVTPDLTDEWVSSNLSESMNLNSVDELNSYVSDNLLFNQQANELYEQLYDAVTVEGDLPDEVNTYFDNYYLYQPYLYAQYYGMTLEDMLSSSGYSSVEGYQEAMTDNRDEFIKQTLILQALAEQLDLVCDTDTLNAEFEDYFGTSDTSSYVESYGENYLKYSVLRNLAMEKLIETVNA